MVHGELEGEIVELAAVVTPGSNLVGEHVEPLGDQAPGLAHALETFALPWMRMALERR